MAESARSLGQRLFPAPGSSENRQKEERVLDLLEGTPRAGLQRASRGIDDYARSAATGDPQAQYEFARVLVSGEPISTENREAVKWLKKAAARDHAASEALLGLLYARGQGVHPNPERAAELFRAAAVAGNADAQYHLGVALENGFGAEQDLREALTWYRLSGAQGHILAQLRVGECYVNGTGCRPDPVQAVLWLRRAAGQGCAEAQLKLGLFYAGEDSDSPGSRDKEAFRWISEAASEGLPEAQFRLALFCVAGRGCEADPALAIEFAKAAAVRSYPQAMLFLSDALFRGAGAGRNITGAMALALRTLQDTDGAFGRDTLSVMEPLATSRERAEAQRLAQSHPTVSALIAALFPVSAGRPAKRIRRI